MPNSKPKQVTIFYAWQSDAPSSTNRGFIEKAIEMSVKRLHADATLEFAEREIELAVDRDTRGVPGSPPIAATILAKIDQCAAFVADLTFVGESMPGLSAGRRLFSNPNVLLEYGYALKTHSHGRIVAVINTAFGEAPHFEHLPFDLRHLRRPIEYRLAPDTPPALRKAALDALVEKLVAAFRLILVSETTATPKPARPAESPSGFHAAPIVSAVSYFRQAGNLIPEPTFEEEPLVIEIPEAPCACVRLYPTNRVAPLKSEMAAKDLATGGDLRPMGVGLSGRSWSRNALGALAYSSPENVTISETDRRPAALRNFTQLFTSGELCGVDLRVVSRIRGHGEKGEFAYRLLKIYDFELSCAKAVKDFLRFSGTALGHNPPLHVAASIRGIKGCMLGLGDARKGNCFRDDVDWSDDALSIDVAPADFMKPFFADVWAAFGIPRPSAAHERLAQRLNQ